MLNLSKIKPRFWDHLDAAAGPTGKQFSFRRKWFLMVLFTTVVTLTPLTIMTLMDYRLTRQAFETEAVTNTSRMVSSVGRSLSLYLSQQRTALEFIARDNTRQALASPERLVIILKHLQNSIGGIVNIGVLDSSGRLLAYAGPAPIEEPQPGRSHWFDQTVANGFYVSDVVSTAADTHRLKVAIRHDLDNGDFIILRTAIDSTFVESLLASLEFDPDNDAFLINAEGMLLTSSRRFGQAFHKILLPLPPPMTGAGLLKGKTPQGEAILAGYIRIPDSSFILMGIFQKSGITDFWLKPRLRLIGFLILSILLIIFAILATATWLISRMHSADQRRVEALHRVEYANKLASIGRLASGVAHEINNPLAIINQKTGLIKDLFTMRPNYAADEKLMGLVDDVLDTIVRCSSITRRLLDFSRHMESSIEPVRIEAIIREILYFTEKEVDQRGIQVQVDIAEGIPEFMGDRGSLQQIFLNLINNAIAALPNGGRLEIAIACLRSDQLQVLVKDNGHGIPEDDIKRVFEPFFSTRDQTVGTGLGLSVTYGLIAEMGGDIIVSSRVGQGTTFTVTLPLHGDQTICDVNSEGNDIKRDSDDR